MSQEKLQLLVIQWTILRSVSHLTLTPYKMYLNQSTETKSQIKEEENLGLVD